jgi:hypothetical protein
MTRIRNVIKCIENPLQIIDLYDSIFELREHDRAKYESLFKGHMTKKGNYFVAQMLFSKLNQP